MPRLIPVLTVPEAERATTTAPNEQVGKEGGLKGRGGSMECRLKFSCAVRMKGKGEKMEGFRWYTPLDVDRAGKYCDGNHSCPRGGRDGTVR